MGDRPHQALTSVDESKIQVSQKPKLVRNDTFDPAKARDLRDATTPKREAAHGKHASLDSPSSEAKRSAKESQAADYAAMTKAGVIYTESCEIMIADTTEPTNMTKPA